MLKKGGRYGNTEIKEILHDALRYPSTSWKNVLILGIITVFSGLGGIAEDLHVQNFVLIGFLIIIGFLVGILASGYLFRIIKSSFAGSAELPEFNSLSEMYLTGIKVFIINIIYLIPSLLFVPGLLLHIGILSFIAGLYILIMIPVILMALTNIVEHDDEFSAAFEFHEILSKMGDIGWSNVIKWYIATGVLFLIIVFIGSMITMIISMVTSMIVGVLLIYLIIMPYLEMYFYRSAALFYMYE